MFMRFMALVFFAFLNLTVLNGWAENVAKSQDAFARVNDIFSKWDNYKSPGCAAGVYRAGRIILRRGYGMADLDHNARIEPSTVFHVASISKQFTAASVILLSLDGKLQLDDLVRKYIPELPDFGAPLTIRQLIHHTSGLRDQWDLLELAGWRYSLDLITNHDVLTLVARQKTLNFPSGSRYMYCNTGYTLLGEIVKRVSGESLREYTTHHIFEPLGMDQTHFRDHHAELVPGMAVGYVPTGGTFEISITNFDTVGATSLLTTVEDLQKWDENFYSPRVGGTALVEMMVKPGTLNNGEVLKYASGLNVTTYRGLPVVDHGGSDAGYRSDLIRFPEQHFSVAVLCNDASAVPSDLVRKVAEVYLGDLMQANPEIQPAHIVQLTEEQLRSKIGVYLNPDGDQIGEINLKDGNLQVAMGGNGPGVPLIPLSENRFRLESAPVEFVFLARADGQKEFEVMRAGEKPAIYDRLPPFDPSTARLADFAGTYHSEEMDALYRFVVEQDKLILRRLNNPDETLKMKAPDCFMSDLGMMEFIRDASRQVTGFVLNSGRIRNFQFARGRR